MSALSEEERAMRALNMPAPRFGYLGKHCRGSQFIFHSTLIVVSTTKLIHLYVRKTSLLWLMVAFLGFSPPAAAQHSAIFSSQIPPGPVEAGRTLVFALSITNTGTESWMAGEFLTFVKIYDFNKEYLTETDKVRQIEEVEPGEAFSVNMTFEVPLNYVGTYYYTVNVEIEDRQTLESRYFEFEVHPFMPKPEEKPRFGGNFKMGYQATEGSDPISNFSLSLSNRIDGQRYRTLSMSGKDFGLDSAEIKSLLLTNASLVGDDQRKVELRAGDISSGLSALTLNKLRGWKLGFTQGRTHLAALVGVNRDTSSGNTTTTPDIYGVKISTDARDDLSLGVNFAGRIEDRTSEPDSASDSTGTFSLEMAHTLASNLRILSEYAWNLPHRGDSQDGAQDSNAFRVEGSFQSEKIYIDGSYRKVGEDFLVPGNEELKRDYLRYNVFMDYLFSRYLTAGFYYWVDIDHPSEEENRLVSTTESVDISFRPPGLPFLNLSYDIDEMKGLSESSVGFPIDDVSYSLHGALSHSFKNIRLSLGYFSSHYKDRIEPGLEDDFSLMTYRLSTKWWDRLSISVGETIEQTKVSGAEDESSPTFSLAMTYDVIPKKLTFSPSWNIERKREGENDQTTTRAIFRYMLSRWNMLECSYSLNNYGSFTNLDDLVSDQTKVDVRWRLIFGRNHTVDVSYFFTGSKDFIQTKTSGTCSVNLTYGYSF